MARAPVSRMASPTVAGVNPPASIHGVSSIMVSRASSLNRRQSKASALPPGRAAPLGGLASNNSQSATET